MCLSKVTEITNRKRRGWKVFYITSGGLRPLFYHRHLTTSIPEESWVKDPKAGKSTGKFSLSPVYRTGFHVFLNKEDAESCASIGANRREIRRVRFRKVVAQGLQSVKNKMAPTVVVEEMYVESGI